MTSNRILPEFQDFLLSHKLVPEKNVPYYALWVSKFLAFSNKSSHLDPNTLNSEFMHSLESRETIADWQLQQAEEALRLYLYHFKGTEILKEARGVARAGKSLSDFPRLLGEMKRLIRMKHYSYSTEHTYLDWAKRFFSYMQETKNKRDASSAITPENVKDFLSHLALKERVSASTQNQAFNAILFLFRQVLREELGDLSGAVRAKRGKRLPAVLSVDEVKALFKHLSGQTLLMAQILYGAGLRLMELARLRVNGIDFEANLIFVRSGKGDNDRTTVLPESVKDQLQAHLKKVKALHEKDLSGGYGEVYLPDALARKYPKAEKEWGWQYVFPSSRLSVDPRSGKIRRHHISDKAIQFAIGKAVQKAHIAKHATVHTLRHYAESRIMPSEGLLSLSTGGLAISYSA
jgi:integron integrase